MTNNTHLDVHLCTSGRICNNSGTHLSLHPSRSSEESGYEKRLCEPNSELGHCAGPGALVSGFIWEEAACVGSVAWAEEEVTKEGGNTTTVLNLLSVLKFWRSFCTLLGLSLWGCSPAFSPPAGHTVTNPFSHEVSQDKIRALLKGNQTRK